MAEAKKKQEVQVEDELQAELQEATEQVAEDNGEAAEEIIPEELAEATDATAEDVQAVIDEQEAETPKPAKAGRRSAKAIREEDAEEARQEAKDQPAEEQPSRAVVHTPNPRNRHGKQYLAAVEKIDRLKQYELAEAVELAKASSFTKFDATVELHAGLGVDPRQADQMVRANVALPHGTGKSLRVAVIAPAAKQAEAKNAGADLVAGEELVAAIEKGTLDFDLLIATPDMMPQLSKAARVLGPRGLMPNPKSGTVTADVAKAVAEAKAGRVEFRIDKQAIVHSTVGKVSFSAENLQANIVALVSAIMKAKPGTAKGTYVKSLALSTSMGPGIRLDVSSTIAETQKR